MLDAHGIQTSPHPRTKLHIGREKIGKRGQNRDKERGRGASARSRRKVANASGEELGSGVADKWGLA